MKVQCSTAWAFVAGEQQFASARRERQRERECLYSFVWMLSQCRSLAAQGRRIALRAKLKDDSSITKAAVMIFGVNPFSTWQSETNLHQAQSKPQPAC